jgi:hypothetical protein
MPIYKEKALAIKANQTRFLVAADFLGSLLILSPTRRFISALTIAIFAGSTVIKKGHDGNHLEDVGHSCAG